jgi:hypothetical protein
MLDRHLPAFVTCLLLALALAAQASVFGTIDACGTTGHALQLKINASRGSLLQGHSMAAAGSCSQAWMSRAESQGLCPMQAKDIPLSLDLPGIGRLPLAPLAFSGHRSLWLVWVKPKGAACDWLCLKMRMQTGAAESPASFPVPPGSQSLSSMRILPAGPACFALRCPGSPAFNRAWLAPQLLGRGWKSVAAAWQEGPWALEKPGQRLLVDLSPMPGEASRLTILCTAKL